MASGDDTLAPGDRPLLSNLPTTSQTVYPSGSALEISGVNSTLSLSPAPGGPEGSLGPPGLGQTRWRCVAGWSGLLVKGEVPVRSTEPGPDTPAAVTRESVSSEGRLPRPVSPRTRSEQAGQCGHGAAAASPPTGRPAGRLPAAALQVLPFPAPSLPRPPPTASVGCSSSSASSRDSGHCGPN